MLYKVALTFESVDEILKCEHSDESYWTVLSVLVLLIMALTFECVNDSLTLTFETNALTVLSSVLISTFVICFVIHQFAEWIVDLFVLIHPKWGSLFRLFLGCYFFLRVKVCVRDRNLLMQTEVAKMSRKIRCRIVQNNHLTKVWFSFVFKNEWNCLSKSSAT